jgi:hypothetical protein
VDVLRHSTTKTDLSDNPLSYECSSSNNVNEKFGDNVKLNCANQEYLEGKRCLSLADSYSVTSTSGTVGIIKNETEGEDDVTPRTEINTESETSVRVDMFIFGIYAFTVCVAIVVVLIITRAVGKPESDEFWWEDKLAKRNY